LPAKQPTINKAPSIKKKDEGDEDDPIAKSLKEREKAGSITSTVDKKLETKKTTAGATPKVGAGKAKEEKKEDKKQPEAKLPLTKEKELKEKKEEEAKKAAADAKKKDSKTVDANKVAPVA
jgi:hypothetical protein